MIRQFFAALMLTLYLPSAWCAEGLNTRASGFSVSETVDRLEAVLSAQGFRIFARVDHGAGARSVDMDLPATELLIFGKPQAGTRLMQAQRSVGLDLPLKYLVWEDEDGQVRIGWNDARWLAERHGIDGASPVIATIAGALEKFAGEAAN